MSVAAVAPAGVDAISPRAGGAVAVAAPPETGPEADILAAELRAVLANAVLANAVAALPERPQRLIDLYYREGHALRDVATTLGVSCATARRDHDTALDALRESCASAGYDRG